MHKVLEMYFNNNAEYLYMKQSGMIKRTVLLKLFYKFNSIPIKTFRCFYFPQEHNKFIQKIEKIYHP